MLLSFMSAPSRSHSTNTRICSPAVVRMHDPHSSHSVLNQNGYNSQAMESEGKMNCNSHSHTLSTAGRPRLSQAIHSWRCSAVLCHLHSHISGAQLWRQAAAPKVQHFSIIVSTAYIHLAPRSIITKQSKGWPEKVTLVLQDKKMAKLRWRGQSLHYLLLHPLHLHKYCFLGILRGIFSP